MNSEFYELIGKSIDCLSTAKIDIVNRKKLIIDSTNYIKDAIRKVDNVDIPINEKFIYDEKTLPNIFIDYYNPKIDYREDVVIPYNFDDYYQRAYKYDDYSLKFKLRYEVDGEVKYIENLSAGNHEVNLGKLSPGIHWYSIQVIDEHGRESRRIFNDLLIIDELYEITEEQTCIITDELLQQYNINKYNSEQLEDMNNNRVGLTKLFADLQQQGYRKCILPTGIYRVNRTKRLGTGDNTPISIPTNFTVDMNGSTFKMHPYDDLEYGSRGGVDNILVRMLGCFDSHLINGTLEGNYAERKAKGWAGGYNGEGDNCFLPSGSKFSSIENVIISNISGYNILSGQTGSKGKARISKWIENTSIENGTEIYKEGYVASDMGTMDETFIQNNYIVASVWLAYGGIKGNYWDIDFHFYDNDENYLESIKVFQYTRCRIPKGATKFRVSLKANIDEVKNLSFHHMQVTRYFEIKNCEFVDNRTCMAPSQCQHLLIEGCKFTRSGEKITPCEIDFEDGWEQQQDIFIRNNEIIENVGTADVIDQAGLNHVFENNKNMSYSIGYRVNGATVRNNDFGGSSCSITFGFMSNNTMRIYNNDDVKISVGGIKDFYRREYVDVLIKDCTVTSISGDIDLYNIRDCTLYAGTFGNSKINNCEIYHKWSYIHDNILITDCNYYNGEDIDYIKFSFNKMDAKRVYTRVNFKSPCQFINHNQFNSGCWIDCVFEDTVLISTDKNTLCDSEIRFDNCTFNKDVTINLKNNAKVQFNNCTFLGDKIFKNNGEKNSIFNDYVPNTLDYISIYPIIYSYYGQSEVEVLNINTDYKVSYFTLPFTKTDAVINYYSTIGTFKDFIVRGDKTGYATLTVEDEDRNLIANKTVKFVDINMALGVYINNKGELSNYGFACYDREYKIINSNVETTISWTNKIGIGNINIAEYDENKTFIRTISSKTFIDNEDKTRKQFTFTSSGNAKYLLIGTINLNRNNEGRYLELFDSIEVSQ